MKISNEIKKIIQSKLNGSNEIPDSYTIIGGKYKQIIHLKFKNEDKMTVSIFKKRMVYKNGKHFITSKYLGKFDVNELFEKRKRTKRTSKRMSKRMSRKRSNKYISNL
jgi:hypothetical protein